MLFSQIMPPSPNPASPKACSIHLTAAKPLLQSASSQCSSRTWFPKYREVPHLHEERACSPVTAHALAQPGRGGEGGSPVFILRSGALPTWRSAPPAGRPYLEGGVLFHVP